MTVFVGIRIPHDEGEDDPIIEESAMTTTIARANAGDGHQSPHAMFLHRCHENARGVREQGRRRPMPSPTEAT
jgi:hypothetical protein